MVGEFSHFWLDLELENARGGSTGCSFESSSKHNLIYPVLFFYTNIWPMV